MSGQYADISWYSVTKLDFDNIASYQLFSVYVQFFAVANDDRKLQLTATEHAMHITQSSEIYSLSQIYTASQKRCHSTFVHYYV